MEHNFLICLSRNRAAEQSLLEHTLHTSYDNVRSMSNIERMTITLTAEMAASVKGAIADGEYASNSEIVREALRDWQHKRELQRYALEALRADVRAGVDDVKASRVHDFDLERIVQKGKQRSAVEPSE